MFMKECALKVSMDDYNWYLEHTLVEYAGKWVAIRQKQVVAAHEDFYQLLEQLKHKGLTLSDVLLAMIPKKDVALLYAQLTSPTLALS